MGRLKTPANLDGPAGCREVRNRKGQDVVSACGSQLRWATAVLTEFARPTRRRTLAYSPARYHAEYDGNDFAGCPKEVDIPTASIFGIYAEFRSDRADVDGRCESEGTDLLIPKAQDVRPNPDVWRCPANPICQRLRPARAEPAWGNRTATRLLTAGGAHQVKESVLESLR